MNSRFYLFGCYICILISIIGVFGTVWAQSASPSPKQKPAAPTTGKSDEPLSVVVFLERPDGTPIDDNVVLKKGESYRVRIKTNKACFIRILTMTPDYEAVCQYYPNPFPGYNTTKQFEPGKDYINDFLPPGQTFQVSEPIGSYDIVRVEVSTKQPFTFVPFDGKNESCRIGRSRGGGIADLNTGGGNPTPDLVVEQKLRTNR
jgi:hypothetical protein